MLESIGLDVTNTNSSRDNAEPTTDDAQLLHGDGRTVACQLGSAAATSE